MRKPLLLLSLGAAGLLFAGADAQVLKNHDSNAPVNFTADRIEVQDRADRVVVSGNVERSEEHTSELQSLMRISYAVFCLKKKITHYKKDSTITTIVQSYNSRSK